jgi:hypothetical protein
LPFQILPNIFKKSLQAKKEVATQACTNDDNSMSGGSVTIVVDSTEAVISMLKKNIYVKFIIKKIGMLSWPNCSLKYKMKYI